jgi:serine/threonine protein kinase
VTPLGDETIDHLRSVLPGGDEGRYRLGAPLGRGGMGVVYEAFDRDLERDVALKVLAAPAPTAAEEERLRREARILARLEHPGIVPVHDVGRLDDGRLFYVMKRVRGRRLDEAVSSDRPLRERLRLLERAAEAVAFAHAQGVLHRDLKPANIMVGEFGEVLVVDWGVASLARGDRDGEAASPSPTTAGSGAVAAFDVTGAGTVLGTPGWMSPEQAAGDVARLTPATDVWGLGAALHWLLIGRPPGPGGDIVRSAGVRVPKRLVAILAKALAADPGARYADAAAFLRDLEAFRDEEAVSAYREGPLDRLARFFRRYRTPILLIATYVLVRILIYLYGRI